MFTTPEISETVSDGAWLQAMLDVEAALARAQSMLGLIPTESAGAIASACAADRFDIEAIGREAAASATPVVPLVDALRASVPGDARTYVHRGATSQDILDTAMMLVARNALDLILADAARVENALAGLADEHRGTVMAGRTLMQQAVPITFGLKAAGWLMGVVEGSAGLRRVRQATLALQLGGAAGTLSAFGDRGLDVAEAMGKDLQLAVPPLPWQTQRGRVSQMAAALAMTAAAMAKIALDVLLMAQTEVGEVSEAAGGRSSAMPHKRNPVGAVLVRACAEQAQGFAAMLLTAGPHEQERAAGAWQAEWTALSSLLAVTGGAVAKAAGMLEGLQVHPRRMRENLDASGGLFASEFLLAELSSLTGEADARRVVDGVVTEVLESGRTLRDVAGVNAAIAGALSGEDLDRVCDPMTHVGMADALIDRALAAYRDAGSDSRG